MSVSEGIAQFTAALRERHGFGVGHAATRDALHAATIVGIDDGPRLRRALRAVYCATPREAADFDAAFDAFFFGATDAAQPNFPGQEIADRHAAVRRRNRHARTRSAAHRTPATTPRTTWHTLRARYSAAAGRSAVPDDPDRRPRRDDGRRRPSRRGRTHRAVPAARAACARRPRRRAAHPARKRRRTPASRSTCDAAGARPRTARFVVLIDGSRSNADDAGPMLQFAFALVQRARDTRAFTFSTGLREITAQLRDPRAAGRTLRDLGDAWGGGTRIGDAVLALLREHGTRALSASTIVFLFSDGLDVGELERLARAMRELRARSSAIVWLHPNADAPGFSPAASGLRVARPYLTALAGAGSAADFERLAARMSRGVRDAGR